MMLVTGGARSGKSAYAQSLALGSERVWYIATSRVFDKEMAARVAEHKLSRPAHWHTLEAWRDVDRLITPELGQKDAVLLECITTLITNELYHQAGEIPEDLWDFAALELAVDYQIDALLAACAACPAQVIIVTNELGMGIVPENRLARHFRDIAGRVNQRLAAEAEAVWLLVSGIEVKIK